MKQLKSMKEEYDNMKVPEQVLDRIEAAVVRAKEDKKKRKPLYFGRKISRFALTAAAVIAVFVILPNANAKVANAMGELPIIGKWVEVLTFRDYQVEEERYHADVTVPVLASQEIGESTEITEAMDKSVAEINFDIQKVTDEIIAEFESNMKEYEEGYQDIYINSEVMGDSDKWFSLKLILYQGAGSGAEWYEFYTINKETGERVRLDDLFREDADYIGVISENIKEQMRTRMQEDENVYYWLDDEDVPEWNFKEISPEQDFYFNENKELVISFDEYEVAPGYMGCVEFLIEDSVLNGLWREE